MSKLIPKHQTPNQPLVLSQDNTRVESPYIESIPITETNLYKQYLADPYKNSDFNTWKKRQELIQSNKKDEKVKADKRAPIVKKQESEQGKAIYNQQQRKEQEAKNNKLIWTGIGLGGLALAQATPAAPWLDAAFATHGALGLAKQYEEGTLGWNGETALNTLQVLPFGVKGVRKIQPVVSDGYKAAKNWAKAKIITSNMKVNPYRFNRGYYTIGHDWDPMAFYHYERNILPKTLGGTRLHPIPSKMGESKIWLSKGKPWLKGDKTIYKIPVDKVKTQSSKIIDPRHAEYHVADEIDLLQDGVEISSPIYIPDKGGFLIIHGNQKFYVPTTKTTPKPTSKSIITNPQSGITLYTPDELVKSGDFAKGKEMAAKFFEHPVVQNSYKHNQELAKRFGITIPDKQAAEVVKQPVQVNYRKLDGNEIAQVSRRYYGDPDTEITMDWSYYPIKDLRQAIIHENLHRGWYSAPLRPQSMTQSYYNNTYKPEYRFWEWKTKKLLDPKYHNDWYLMDIHSGEAGPNFIDLGRDLGLKLGQKYPGYKEVKQMLQNYKGNKSFMIPKLNYSKAGIRHVWDAMTGKYFMIPATIGIGGATITNKYE